MSYSSFIDVLFFVTMSVMLWTKLRLFYSCSDGKQHISEGTYEANQEVTVAKKVISFTLLTLFTVSYLADRSNCKSVALWLWVWDIFCDWELAKSIIKLREWEAGKGDLWWGDGWVQSWWVRSLSVSDCQTVFIILWMLSTQVESENVKWTLLSLSLSGIHQWQWKYCEKSVGIFTKPL